jgi:endonuclease/exonuclease/phosphatase family metal-dependent hydrolase
MNFLRTGAGRSAPLLLAAALMLPAVASAQNLKVLDWNTHHGVGTDGVYNLQRFVTWIVRSGAHVVSLNEVEKNNSWGNEDQPARYAALLRSATGKTWYYKFAQRDGGSNGQGNLILSTIPFEATGETTLSYSRSVARVQIVVNGVRVNIFSTHLDADSASRRATQMDELNDWVSGYSQQHIMAGDFNAWPGASEIGNMTAVAYDAWAVAKNNGTAVAYDGNSAGNTRNSRIDYIWYSKRATQLVLKGAQVFDTRDANGVMPSDHRPVMATFQVGGGDTTVITPRVVPAKFKGDFDGDLKSDISVFRPTTGEWFVARSGGAGMMQAAWGGGGDIPVPFDYDGDGKADVAVFRPSTGVWWIVPSTTGRHYTVAWGAGGDIPAVGDYDGDSKADIAVFRPSTGVWWIVLSATGRPSAVVWGTGGDVPVAGDYDGDGRTDIAVFRPSSAAWYIIRSATGTAFATTWGVGGDTPVVGDYDGDGRADIAVFRPSSAGWYVIQSATGAGSSVAWGTGGDIPVVGDYDGDGRADIAVFRPSVGRWYIVGSATGSVYAAVWGSDGDAPLPGR